MTQPALPDLFGKRTREIADTSLESWDAVRKNLPLRDLEMCLNVAIYCRDMGRPDVTGGELSVWFGLPILSVRPSLCRAQQAGWLQSGEIRASRMGWEKRCHPYSLAVPREAVERAIREAKKTAKTA